MMIKNYDVFSAKKVKWDYPKNFEISFKNKASTDVNKDSVRAWIDHFPAELLAAPSGDFGCPDCYDQGGYYIEINIEGTQKFWHIDPDLKDVPDFIQGYLDVLATNPIPVQE